MNFKQCKIIGLLAFFIPGLASAVGFTKDELELVKDACLAGSSFEIKTEANGSVSIKNMEGKGKILVSQKDVTTVDLPDADKKQEFTDIRACIKDYLTNKSPTPEDSIIVLKEWNFRYAHDSTTPGVGIHEARLLIDGSNPKEFPSIGFGDGQGELGVRYGGMTLHLTPVDHTATFEVDYSIHSQDPPAKATASCSAILSGKHSGELTPEIHATINGPEMHIESCTIK